MRLSAVEPAFAEHAARTQGDAGLDRVVAVPQGILGWVDQCEYPAPLIVVHEGPENGHEGHGGCRDPDQYLPAQSSEEHDEKPGGGDQYRRAEIGLVRYE